MPADSIAFTRTVAARALRLLDLTSLGADDTAAAIDALCERACAPAGPVAAVCLHAPFVAQARALLDGTGIRVATVANFLSGAADADAAAAETEAAVAAGAHEVDVVLPYAALLAGERSRAERLVRRCREACGVHARLKVILETGRLGSVAAIADAAAIAIAAGADFIKTSTGTLSPGATPEAARAMLEVIARVGGDRVGFKAAGGIRTTAQAAEYLRLADRILGPDWATPARFRIGASGLLDALLADLGYAAPSGSASAY